MFIEVILPVPLDNTYTYFVPPEMEAQIVSGGLVGVDFGKKRYIGLVASIHNTPPDDIKEIKPIAEVVASSVIRKPQLKFWQWIADYYFCKLGDVYKAVIPSGFRTGNLPKRKRKSKGTGETIPLNSLNPIQDEALKQIKASFTKKDVCLLHGVTSSGKTEIYTHLIEENLRAGKQVLYMLPEITLTAQITNRLERFFGEKLSVYHSRVTDTERIHLWNNILNEPDARIILGVRSSIFLPFSNLGLIIVDEEHEPSYKQQDPAPRYHARNAAIILAKMHGAKVLLGSATPSIESYHNAQTQKFGYVYLGKRYKETELPNITAVNTWDLRRRKKMTGKIFSPPLTEAIGEALDKNEQILLFQNRRGFAPAIVCRTCDWTPKCRFCDISLTYHKGRYEQLTCHYCGRKYQIPKECPECKGTELKPIGFGTEKVEEELKERFPDVQVERMDADTTKNKKSLDGLVSRFESGDTRILIGTQMISKGLDFGKVSLVGILNADALMNFPDFRAYERAYQLMSQVAGRSGRREEQGHVILQTSHPDNPLIEQVIRHDYEAMYRDQVEERQLFHYPPFFRLIHINLKHKKESVLNSLADNYAEALRSKLGDRVVGPDKPFSGRIQNLYQKRILLKVETSASITSLRNILNQVQEEVMGNPDYRYTIIQYDIDPL